VKLKKGYKSNVDVKQKKKFVFSKKDRGLFCAKRANVKRVVVGFWTRVSLFAGCKSVKKTTKPK
jgi:hypothetical protein